MRKAKVKKVPKAVAQKPTSESDDEGDVKISAAAAADDDEDDGEDANVQLIEPFAGLKALCLSETFSDVHFLVGKEKGKTERIPGHRLVLAANNPVFAALLYPLVIADGKATYETGSGSGSAADTKSGGDVVIGDATPSAFKKMLTAIYTDELEITADDVTELVALAKRYHVESLKALCVEFLEQDVTAEKACTLFVEGRKLLNEPAFGLAFIEENLEDVVKTDGWLDLPRDCLETLLRSNKLSIDESDLWVAVDKWAAAEVKRTSTSASDTKVDGKAKREVLGDCVQLIRFPLIEMQDLCAKVQPSNVLSQDELLGLFTYIAAPESAKPATPFNTRERTAGSSKIVIEEFKWSTKLSNGARVRCEGQSVVSIAPTCNSDVLAIADTKGWSSGLHYWRINIAQGGCLRRVGVVDGEFPANKLGGNENWSQQNQPALGATANSWAVAIDGSNYGEVNWYNASGTLSTGDVGLLLDCKNKKLHVFNGATGQYVACAFTNVKGKKLRPALLMCHSNSRANVVPKSGINAAAIKLPGK